MTHDLSRPHYCYNISVTASLSDEFVVSLETHATLHHNSGTDVALDRLALDVYIITVSGVGEGGGRGGNCPPHFLDMFAP